MPEKKPTNHRIRSRWMSGKSRPSPLTEPEDVGKETDQPPHEKPIETNRTALPENLGRRTISSYSGGWIAFRLVSIGSCDNS
ncbi:unnamed protein product [Arabidopsis lyrata]|nr:unnamed protein product [Arabidopsis lyrata]